MQQKMKYMFDSTLKNIKNEGFSCPSCGCQDSEIVSRKYLVTALRRCSACQLLFRTPTTTPEENASFYQEEYTQGFTTDCPSDEVLSEYLACSFSGGQKDYSNYIDVILAAGGKEGDRLFDFGCSWGYGSWQFKEKGFDVESFEISLPRAKYARDKLGVNVYSSLDDIQGQFDIFFSSHVLEHVPSVKDSIDFGMSLLKPGGLFVAFTPNGSNQYRQVENSTWDKLWGLVHPNFLDDGFYEKLFSNKEIMLSSHPYPLEDIKAWSESGQYDKQKSQLDSDELLILVKK